MIKDRHIVRLKNLLLAFVLVSVGFSFGRHSVKPSASGGGLPDGGVNTSVAVYYLHSTFRCATCDNIERMTKEFLDSNYQKELSSGAMSFHEVNFQENEELAKRFGVVASCVVVAALDGGKVLDFLRLDEAWTRMKERKIFDAYLNEAVEKMKSKAGGNK